MFNNKKPIKLIFIVFLFLFIGILIIQSTGCFNNNYSHNISTNSVNPSPESEILKNDIDNNLEPSSNEDYDIHSSSDLVISNFIDKTKQRYPQITKIGKDIGLSKKGVLNIIETLHCEKIISNYISYFSSVFGI